MQRRRRNERWSALLCGLGEIYLANDERADDAAEAPERAVVSPLDAG